MVERRNPMDRRRTGSFAGLLAPLATLATLATLVALAAAGGPAAAQFVEPVELLYVFDGESAQDGFGRVVRAMGDLDGDGVTDLGAATPENDAHGPNSGRVYLFSGATGDTIRVHHGETNDFYGYRYATIGDIDGDQIPEYVVTAPHTITFQQFFGVGEAYLYDGATGALLHAWTGTSFGDGFGAALTGGGSFDTGGAGDIDGDGVPDILLGANLHVVSGAPRGRAWVYSGANPPQAIHTVDGPSSVSLFGFGVGGLGDLNGDGRGEFIVGAPNAGPGGRGAAYVYDGASGVELPFSPLVADATGDFYGFLFTSSPGDVDGDGVPDIFVSDIRDAEVALSSGKIFLYSGADGALLFKRSGEGEGDGFGVGGGCGDVDHDGRADLVVASFESSVHLPTAGKAFIISGADGTDLRTLTCDIEGDAFGWSAVGLGDLDGDGPLDYMISALRHDTGGEDAGRVYVISGAVPSTAVGEGARHPALGEKLRLIGSSPNPVRAGSGARLRFQLAAPARVAVDVFDARGRHQRRLPPVHLASGGRTLSWDGRNDAGTRVPSGVYFYRLHALGHEARGRLVLVE